MSISFFSSIEFYIILAVIAAAIVAFSARPSSKGPASEFFLAGNLLQDQACCSPQITLTCLPNGKVEILRQGLPEIYDDGAVSLAAKLIGTDLFIEERIVPGRCDDEILCPKAIFTVGFLRPGRYHIKYNSQSTGLFAAFPFHVSPGITTVKILSQ